MFERGERKGRDSIDIFTRYSNTHTTAHFVSIPSLHIRELWADYASIQYLYTHQTQPHHPPARSWHVNLCCLTINTKVNYIPVVICCGDPVRRVIIVTTHVRNASAVHIYIWWEKGKNKVLYVFYISSKSREKYVQEPLGSSRENHIRDGDNKPERGGLSSSRRAMMCRIHTRLR